MLPAPGHRPSKQPAPPGPEGADDGGEVDWISALPDDLLHLVLIRLKCAREAARTSVLARRWRNLWTRLPEYFFHDINHDVVEAALARVTRPALDYLGIKAEVTWESDLNVVSSLLCAAARLSPATVNIDLYDPLDADAAPIELPCFDRTSTLILELNGMPLAPPPAGEFSRLEVLELSTGSNILAALLPSCPRLRVLRICTFPEITELTVHSTTLEELEVEHCLSYIHQIDINAPELKKSMLNVEMARDLSLTFSAPKVEKLVWKFPCIENVGSANYRLMSLEYDLLQGVRTLLLEIDYWPAEDDDVPDRSFVQEVARLGVIDFSVLNIAVGKNGHAFGPLLLDLLQIRPTIQVLKVNIVRDEVYDEELDEEEELCPQNCPCRLPINWKTETISLFDLEDIFISYDFDVGEEEPNLSRWERGKERNTIFMVVPCEFRSQRHFLIKFSARTSRLVASAVFVRSPSQPTLFTALGSLAPTPSTTPVHVQSSRVSCCQLSATASTSSVC